MSFPIFRHFSPSVSDFFQITAFPEFADITVLIFTYQIINLMVNCVICNLKGLNQPDQHHLWHNNIEVLQYACKLIYQHDRCNVLSNQNHESKIETSILSNFRNSPTDQECCTDHDKIHQLFNNSL